MSTHDRTLRSRERGPGVLGDEPPCWGRLNVSARRAVEAEPLEVVIRGGEGVAGLEAEAGAGHRVQDRAGKGRLVCEDETQNRRGSLEKETGARGVLEGRYDRFRSNQAMEMAQQYTKAKIIPVASEWVVEIEAKQAMERGGTSLRSVQSWKRLYAKVYLRGEYTGSIRARRDCSIVLTPARQGVGRGNNTWERDLAVEEDHGDAWEHAEEYASLRSTGGGPEWEAIAECLDLDWDTQMMVRRGMVIGGAGVEDGN
ncbi:hypothetical protein Tco_1256578 [Tanacetum coccineum]